MKVAIVLDLLENFTLEVNSINRIAACIAAYYGTLY